MGIQDRDYMRRRGGDDRDHRDDYSDDDSSGLARPLLARMGQWTMIGAIALVVVVIVVLALNK